MIRTIVYNVNSSPLIEEGWIHPSASDPGPGSQVRQASLYFRRLCCGSDLPDLYYVRFLWRPQLSFPTWVSVHRNACHTVASISWFVLASFLPRGLDPAPGFPAA